MTDTDVMNTGSISSRRLFLACWPDQALQELLYELAQHLQEKHGGKVTKRENIHLTLVFLGQVQRHKERQLREQLRILDFKQFDLELDQTGSFTHCRINWVGPGNIPDGLKNLHLALKDVTQGLGFLTEDRPYKPHVSLLRNADSKSGQAIEPMPWKVDRYCLIESKLNSEGVQYELLEEFQLT